jgi:hypothetical protein
VVAATVEVILATASSAFSVLVLSLEGICPFQEFSSIGLQGASGFLVSNGVRELKGTTSVRA